MEGIIRVMKRAPGAAVFVLTLFVSTAGDERAAPVQSLGRFHMAADAQAPFLCDSLQAEDCFAMFVTEHPAESVTVAPPGRRSFAGKRLLEPVACLFELSFRGFRCGGVSRSP
jgi:hypothetical protein